MFSGVRVGPSLLEQSTREGESPVGTAPGLLYEALSTSRVVWECCPKLGRKFVLKLNIGTRPIANKYSDGKMKSTLKRELKARETVKREPIEASSAGGAISPASRSQYA